MTFTTSLKEEISKIVINEVEDRHELNAFLNCTSVFKKNELVITLENASVARKIYKELKEIYKINPQILIRIQNRFKKKQIYILKINKRVAFIKKSISLGNKVGLETLVSPEEKIAFLRGAFLAVGNISNPKTSGYHLEFILKKELLAKQILNVLQSLKFSGKLIKRAYKYVVYIKSGDEISDIIKAFKAVNSLFYFEDIRIYRDHKNMVNRLNNCEIANQEKILKAGLKQLAAIKYLRKEKIFDLLGENTKIVAEYRERYPEISYQELATLISSETNYKIGKSGINHQFIKISQLIKKYKDNRK